MGFWDTIGSSLTEGATDLVKSIPKLIVSGIGAYGASRAQGEVADQAQADRDFQSQLLDKKFQQEVELMKLKAALGGGGGGGGGVDMRPYIYQGRLQARQAAMDSAQGSSGLTIEALRNLMDAAQRPLIR